MSLGVVSFVSVCLVAVGCCRAGLVLRYISRVSVLRYSYFSFKRYFLTESFSFKIRQIIKRQRFSDDMVTCIIVLFLFPLIFIPRAVAIHRSYRYSII